MKLNRLKYVHFLILTLFISIIFIIYIINGMNDGIYNYIRKYLLITLNFKNENYKTMLFFFCLFIIFVTIFSLPLPPFFKPLSAGMIFGQYLGSFICIFSVCFATFIFINFFKVFLSIEFIKKKTTEAPKFIKKTIENEFLFIFFLRLIPGVPFIIQNITISLMKTSYLFFIPATFLGLIPSYLIMTKIGSNLGDVIITQPDFELNYILSINNITMICVYIFFISLLHFFSKKFFKKNK